MPKRTLRHALALGVAIVCVAARTSTLAAQVRPAAVVTTLKHGDVSGEGLVSALDAQAILTAAVGLPLPSTYVAGNGVAICDGRTLPQASDALVVLRYAIGLNVSAYCVGQPFGPAATTMVMTPLDSSVRITSTRVFKAVLRQADSSRIQRPISWSSSAPAIAVLDSVKNDSLAYFRGVAAGSATITAFADGVSFSTPLKVVSSYEGIIIQPQRGDTLHQIGGSITMYARSRDSLGNITNYYPPVFWSTADPTIAVVRDPALPTTAQYYGEIESKGTGTTWVRVTSQSNPAFRDSVPLTVVLPSVNSCVAGNGTLHQNVAYSTPQTWTVATQPHFVSGSVQFSSGANLTLEPGVLVCMNSGASLTIHDGARLSAVGTVANPITFTSSSSSDVWQQIQLGDYNSFSQPAVDTSTFTNVLFENTYYGIQSYHRHVTLLDSVKVRQFGYRAVTLYAPGSRMIRSRIDSTRVGYNGTAAEIYRGSVEESSIDMGPGGTGITFSDAGLARAVTVVNGATGVNGGCCSFAPRLNDVTVAHMTGIGLDLQYVTLDTASSGVQIIQVGSYPLRGPISVMGTLFADSVAQETLKGHARDTVVINGGSLARDTVLVRADVPWIVTSTTYVDSLARLVVHPGATMQFQYASLTFRQGGTLDARGTAAQPIHFMPAAGSYWYGLGFYSPGGGSNPFSTAPVAQSYLMNARVDSALGTGTDGGFGGSAAVNAGTDRHRLIVDSVTIHKAFAGAVYLGTRRSSLSRSVIDTTGNPTTSSPAVALGDSVTMRQTVVRRSGNTNTSGAVYATGAGARLIQDTIVGGVGVGVYAQDGILDRDSAAVRIFGNSYPARLRIENLAALARDSVKQLQFMDNGDSVVVISGGSLSFDTVTAIPQLRWQIENTTTFDTLSQFVARPGARVSVLYSTVQFQRGGTLDARGTAAAPIHFYSLPGYYWYGLSFYSPGQGSNPFATAPVAESYLTNVRVDSAQGTGVSGGLGGSAAINAGDRHRLTLDSVVVHKAFNGAVFLATRGSRLSRSLIDTTGNPTTGSSAVALGDSTTMEATLVRRAGNVGAAAAVYVQGSGVSLIADTIRRSLGVGLLAQDGIMLRPSTIPVLTEGPPPSGIPPVVVDSSAYPARLRIENLAILAGDSVGQMAFMENTDSVVVVTGGNLTNALVVTIPQLRWQVENYVYFDTLSLLQVQPGSRLSYVYGGMQFRAGGALDARGTATDPIHFYPVPGYYWYGLAFYNPGPGSNAFASAPVADSYIMNARVDSAQGMGVSGGFGGSAAINASDRHRLTIDSVTVHKAVNGAVFLATRGSRLSRSVIDTTGNPTTGYAAVSLGDSVTMEETVIRRSGQVGLRATGSGVRLLNDSVYDSQQYGLYAEQGIIEGDSGSVVLSGNQYAGRLRIENLAALAPDSLAQDRWLGNGTDLIVVTGGTLANDTLVSIPQLRWQVESTPSVGAGGDFQPHPGSQLGFYYSGLTFTSGGTLHAFGTSTDSIHFGPVSGGSFYGLRFDNPSSGRASSSLVYARLDSAQGTSATGGFSGSAAINGGSTHDLLITNVRVRKAWNGALWLRAGSLTDVSVDTTGNPGSGTTGYWAVHLGDSAIVSNLYVRRSGQVGIRVEGTGISWSNVVVDGSLAAGIDIVTAGVSLSSFEIMNSGGNGVTVQANNGQVSFCKIHDNAGHGVATNSSYTGVAVHSCSLVNNGGNGVDNANTSNVAYQINATNNYWGDPSGPVGATGDGVSANVAVDPACSSDCSLPAFAPTGSGVPPAPAVPITEYVWQRERRRARRRRSA